MSTLNARLILRRKLNTTRQHGVAKHLEEQPSESNVAVVLSFLRSISLALSVLIDFYHYGLKSGMVFKGTTGAYKRICLFRPLNE